jgi:hypothetical protein
MTATSKTRKTRNSKRSLEQGEADPSRDGASDVKDELAEIAAPVIPKDTGTLLSEVTKPMLNKVHRASQKSGK